MLLPAGNILCAQYVYTINADSVKITNHCDTAELIIENHTQNVPGFLFNKGRGRTEFRRAATALNDSTYLVGADTIHTSRPSFWREVSDYSFGNGIYNKNAGNVGIGVSLPERALDVNGALRIRSGRLELQGPRNGIRQTCLSTHIFNGCGTVGYISFGFDSLTGVATYSPDPLTIQQSNMSVGINNNNPQAKLHIKGAGVGNTSSALLVHNNASSELFRILDNGNIGIGRTDPRVMLDMPGPVNIDDTSSYRINYRPVLSIHYPDADGYTTLYAGDSSGANSSGAYNTLIGGRTGINNLGSNATFVGYSAGHDSEGENNTFVGSFSGENNSGDPFSTPPGQNSFFGYSSGQYSSGNNNTFLGAYVGTANTGYSNTFAGVNAGQYNNGSFNLLLGDLSGLYNTGDENICVGAGAGAYNNGNFNILVGRDAGISNTGFSNVFMGIRSGYSNIGSNNTFLGNTAGYVQASGRGVTGNSITLLGSGTMTGTAANLSNATAIGANAVVNSSGTMVFGDGGVTKWIFNSNATALSGAALTVGINATNGNGAYLSNGGVWTNASDRDKKENFDSVNVNDLLEKIALLPIARWNYKGTEGQHIGPVAQDFYRLFQLGTDDKSISTIDPAGIALAAVQGLYRQCQEATTKATAQEEKIKHLESRIDSQQQQLSQLSEIVGRLQATVSKTK